MTTPNELAQLVQARLDRDYPGQYRVFPQGGHHIEGNGTDFCITPADDDGLHGAVFHIDNLVSEQKGVEVAADRLYGTVNQVIGAGLPEKRVGEYLAYDAL